LYFVKILSGSKKFKIITYVFAVAEFRVRRLLPLSWQCIYISQSPFLTTEWMYMMSYFRLFWYHVLYLSLHLQRSICTWSSESLSCESHIWWWLAYLSRIPQCDQISSYPILNLFGRKKERNLDLFTALAINGFYEMSRWDQVSVSRVKDSFFIVRNVFRIMEYTKTIHKYSALFRSTSVNNC
jgi:hypothetical protein